MRFTGAVHEQFSSNIMAHTWNHFCKCCYESITTPNDNLSPGTKVLRRVSVQIFYGLNKRALSSVKAY